jgi:hypothetical protein
VNHNDLGRRLTDRLPQLQDRFARHANVLGVFIARRRIRPAHKAIWALENR